VPMLCFFFFAAKFSNDSLSAFHGLILL